jgi:hypothetical protein
MFGKKSTLRKEGYLEGISFNEKGKRKRVTLHIVIYLKMRQRWAFVRNKRVPGRKFNPRDLWALLRVVDPPLPFRRAAPRTGIYYKGPPNAKPKMNPAANPRRTPSPKPTQSAVCTHRH